MYGKAGVQMGSQVLQQAQAQWFLADPAELGHWHRRQQQAPGNSR